MTVSEVNGLKAVFEEDGAYWALYVNGLYGEYAVSAQPIEEGDEFILDYTKD